MVAGDGLPHEVYNGLMERPDAESAIKMPVGIIPGGSADGLARSLCYATGYVAFVFILIDDYLPQIYTHIRTRTNKFSSNSGLTFRQRAVR